VINACLALSEKPGYDHSMILMEHILARIPHRRHHQWPRRVLLRCLPHWARPHLCSGSLYYEDIDKVGGRRQIIHHELPYS